MKFTALPAIACALFCHLLTPISAQAWDLSQYFKTDPLPECQTQIDRGAGQSPDEMIISIRAYCDTPQTRNLIVTVSDGTSLKTIKDCPSRVDLIKDSQSYMCSFAISNFESKRVQSQIQMDRDVISRDEIYRKVPTFKTLPIVRILKGGRTVTPIDLRVLVEDKDVDYFSGAYNAVDAMMKTPEGDRVLISTTVRGDHREARFKWDKLNLPAGDYQIFFRAYDAYSENYPNGEYVDSDVLTVRFENIGS